MKPTSCVCQGEQILMFGCGHPFVRPRRPSLRPDLGHDRLGSLEADAAARREAPGARSLTTKLTPTL